MLFLCLFLIFLVFFMLVVFSFTSVSMTIKKLLYASRISGRDEINLDDFDAQSRQVRSNCFIKHNQKRET